jgi:hypothetical protein
LSQEESKFLTNLNYQISTRDHFLKKIPQFHEKIEMLDFKIGLKESISVLKKSYQEKRRTQVYRTIVGELKDLIEKNNQRRQKS